MYTPPAFAVSDRYTLHDFVEANSFATLVSADGSNVEASHLPLLLDRDSGASGTLVGHMAKANPHWRSLDGREVLAIFHGPHAYISAGWYGEQNVVPTWNYVAVHAGGILRIDNDRERLLDIVNRYVQFYETQQATPWPLESADKQFVDKLLDAIVGFTVEITQLEGKWKLNQNHSAERQQRVVDGLRSQPDAGSQQIADLMQQNLAAER
ncbi:MAG: FMN-binding negative transcriptional regulator [Planctomycetota bacterium]|jgi:transcriptional regulator